MKFTAAREALLKPLQAVIGVVERRQTMPILSNVLIIAKEGRVSITATDLEVELVAEADVNTDRRRRDNGIRSQAPRHLSCATGRARRLMSSA